MDRPAGTVHDPRARRAAAARSAGGGHAGVAGPDRDPAPGDHAVVHPEDGGGGRGADADVGLDAADSDRFRPADVRVDRRGVRSVTAWAATFVLVLGRVGALFSMLPL